MAIRKIKRGGGRKLKASPVDVEEKPNGEEALGGEGEIRTWSEAADNDGDDEDRDVGLDIDRISNAVCESVGSNSRATYQVQLRLPAAIEPMYKSLSPKVKRALKEAYVSLIERTYEKLH